MYLLFTVSTELSPFFVAQTLICLEDSAVQCRVAMDEEDNIMMEEMEIWRPRVNMFMESLKTIEQEKYSNILLSVVMVSLSKMIFIWNILL